MGMSQTAVGRDWLGYRGKWMRNIARILPLLRIITTANKDEADAQNTR